MNLKSMPVDKLMDLRGRVEAALTNRVAEKRRSLESELTKLTRASTHFNRGHAGARGGGKIAPKYRNPENPSETWAGRGLQPRWLAAALKAGKKLEHFSIAASAKTAAKKGRPKVRAARKK
jgi:DNA-binding protein H-NS